MDINSGQISPVAIEIAISKIRIHYLENYAGFSTNRLQSYFSALTGLAVATDFRHPSITTEQENASSMMDALRGGLSS